MKVYAVLWGAAYEGESLEAIFSTEEAANACAERLGTDHHRVQEVTLDEEPKKS